MEIATQVIAGTYKTESYYGGMDQAIVDLAPLSARVSDETKKLIDQLKIAQIKKVVLSVAEAYEGIVGRFLAEDVVDTITGESVGLKGLFAAGDVRATPFRQLVVAAGPALGGGGDDRLRQGIIFVEAFREGIAVDIAFTQRVAVP